MSKTRATAPLHHQLTKLETEATALAEHAQALRDSGRAARDAAAEADAALSGELRRLAAKRADTSAKADELTKALEAAQARAAEPWPARIADAADAARDADAKVSAFINEHLDALIAELTPGAVLARDQLAEAVQAFHAALATRRDVERRAKAFVSRAEAIDGQAFPTVTFRAPTITVPGMYGDKAIEPDDVPLPLPSSGLLKRRRYVREHGESRPPRSSGVAGSAPPHVLRVLRDRRARG